MSNPVEEYLLQHPNKRLSRRTIAKRLNLNNRIVKIFAKLADKKGSIRRVSPIEVGSCKHVNKFVVYQAVV